MRFLTAMVLAFALVAVAAPADAARKVGDKTAVKTNDGFTAAEDVLKWISNYRFEPAPDRLPAAVKAMSRLGLLRDHEKSGVYVGFIAGILGSNRLKAPKLIAKMFPLPPEEQPVLIRAIAYSGLADWKDVLKQFVERMPARRVLIGRFLYDKEKPLFQAALDKGPEVLDAHWGYYFATGLYQPVTRIISALQWSTNKKDLKKLTIGSMAKWTLATNASRDKALLDLCRQELEATPKAKRKPLYEVVKAAQSYETTTIRKDALAAIDELKRNPNASSAKWYSAANIGSTALAVGCVVAAATGHAELGVPCIITGALSSAALKLWGNGMLSTGAGLFGEK